MTALLWILLGALVIGVGLAVRAAWRRLPAEEYDADTMKRIATRHDVEQRQRGEPQ